MVPDGDSGESDHGVDGVGSGAARLHVLCESLNRRQAHSLKRYSGGFSRAQDTDRVHPQRHGTWTRQR